MQIETTFNTNLQTIHYQVSTMKENDLGEITPAPWHLANLIELSRHDDKLGGWVVVNSRKDFNVYAGAVYIWLKDEEKDMSVLIGSDGAVYEDTEELWVTFADASDFEYSGEKDIWHSQQTQVYARDEFRTHGELTVWPLEAITNMMALSQGCRENLKFSVPSTLAADITGYLAHESEGWDMEEYPDEEFTTIVLRPILQEVEL